MVFTAAQTTAFFTDPSQMALPRATRDAIGEEGLNDIDDLVEFDSDSMKQITDNLRRPGGRIPDPDPTAAVGATIRTPTFVFGAKSQVRLAAAIEIAKYYETTGRDLTVSNMRWNPTIKTFNDHWKSLKARKDETNPEVPKISKTLHIMKWTEAFSDFTRRVIGTRTIPLSYVIRDMVNVPSAAPALSRLSGSTATSLRQEPFSDDFGSVEEELIGRATHSHPLYRDDNATIYFFLEEATRSTMYASSIQPHSRRKDGRGAWLALTNQYAGKDKWSAELKKQDDLIHTYKWKGQANFSLDKFIAQHRNAFVSMQQCSVHVAFQLPNEYTRVGYLLDAIETSDASLQAAMALVRNDTDTVTGKRSDFEATATCLLPHDPVAKKRNTRGGNERQRGAEVSSISSSTIKSGIGSTGVDLRYHKLDEYKKLSPEQKSELHEWRSNQTEEQKKAGKKGVAGKRKSSNTTNNTNDKQSKRIKKLISSAIASERKKVADAEDDTPSQDQLDGAYLLSLVKAQASSTSVKIADSTTADKPPSVTLQSILKRVKH